MVSYGHLCVVGGVAGSDASPTCVSQEVQHLFVFFVFSIFVLVTRYNILVLGLRTSCKGGNIYIFELANLLDKVLHAGELLPLAHVVTDNTMKTI